jgi:hypothetical protein
MNEAAATVRNRRLAVRRPSKRTVKSTCRRGMFDFGTNLALTILDVSETGISMLVKERLDPHQQVTFTLEGVSHRRPLRHTARVVWCMETTDQKFCVGFRFDKRLPWAEMGKLA